MHTKSDAQIMKIKVEILKAENATEKEVLTALDDLEYYVHQIDNAVDLDKIHGMEVVIKYLNNSNVELQEQAAKVVGAAVQRYELLLQYFNDFNVKFAKIVGQAYANRES